MSAFVQDADLNWWFFFWGDKVHWKEVEDISILDTIDGINKWISDNGFNAGSGFDNVFVSMKTPYD